MTKRAISSKPCVKAISGTEKDNRQELLDERKKFQDQIGRESVRLVQEDLDEMNRITIGRSAMEEAAVARVEFEEQYAVKLDAAGRPWRIMPATSSSVL